MLGQKNKTHIIVGKDLAPLAETETREDLAVGQIGVFKNGSNLAIDGTTDLTSGDKFKIVFKDVDGVVIESPMYDYDLIKQKSAANYVASTEQLSYIGYNGTTGSIAVANSSIYHIHVTRKDWSKTWCEHGNIKLAAAFESDAAALQDEIADALVVNMSKNFEIEKAKSGVAVTTVSRINSEAVTANDDFVNAILVEKGGAKLVGAATVDVTAGTSGSMTITGVGGLSKAETYGTSFTATATAFFTNHAAAYLAVGIVLTNPASGTTLVFTPVNATIGTADPVFTGTGDMAATVFTAFEYATNTSLAVNDYVRLGATTTTATALTSSIYKVTAISGNVATLDIPVVEATGTYASGAGYTEAITNADAIAEDWGLAIKSEPVKFAPGLFKFQNVSFTVALSSAFASTIVTEDTAPGKGIGTYKEVAEIEWELRNNNREAYHVASYPVQENLNAISTKTYDLINVDFANDNARTLNGYDYSFHGITIATEDESGSTIHTDLKDILNI